MLLIVFEEKLEMGVLDLNTFYDGICYYGVGTRLLTNVPDTICF